MKSLLELIQEDTILRQRGKEFYGKCVFHDEKTPSFTVSPEKELFYCFSCLTGGDIITYLTKKRGYSIREALRLAGRELSEQERTDAERKKIARDKILTPFYGWRHEKLRALTTLHDEIEIAEIAYRSINRSPQTWPEDQADYWTTRLGDLYFALTVAQQENEILADDAEAWARWKAEQFALCVERRSLDLNTNA